MSSFLKVSRRAGIKAWPKLFHNICATRQAELLAQFSAKNVSDWLGNSQAVAMKHYAMATDDSLRRAICGSISTPAVESNSVEIVRDPQKTMFLRVPENW